MKVCECGCGQEITKKGNRFINGHNSRGKNNPMCGVHLKGKNNPMYGKHHTEETKKKQSEAKKGENHPMYGVHRIGKDAPMYGKKHTEKARKKQSEAKKGKYEGENNPMYGIHRIGKDAPMYGHKHTEKTRKKQSESQIRYMQNNKDRFKDTSIELKIEDELKRAGLNYQKQFYIKMVGIVDFLLPDYTVIIECDGDYWHNRPSSRKKDSNRDFMATFGDRYEIVRFWEHEINESSKKCMKRLLKVIKKRRRK